MFRDSGNLGSKNLQGFRLLNNVIVLPPCVFIWNCNNLQSIFMEAYKPTFKCSQAWDLGQNVINMYWDPEGNH